jgi:hypothetical protein
LLIDVDAIKKLRDATVRENLAIKKLNCGINGVLAPEALVEI